MIRFWAKISDVLWLVGHLALAAGIIRAAESLPGRLDAYDRAWTVLESVWPGPHPSGRHLRTASSPVVDLAARRQAG